MKYVAPYGVADPNASYVNGNPSTGVQGSIPPAEAFEHPLREISSMITKSAITPSPNDLLQMTKAVRSQYLNYGVDRSNLANTLTVQYDPPMSPYTPGLVLRVKVSAANTGPTTIEAGGGRVKILRPDGLELQANDLPKNAIAEICYDGSKFQLTNFKPNVADVINNNNYTTPIPYCVDESNSANYIFITPTVDDVSEGDAFLVKIAHYNSGPTQIKVDARPYAQVRFGNEQLLPGDLDVGNVKLIVFDGTYYQVIPNDVISKPVQISVPNTNYGADANAVLKLLARKRIGPDAYVTIKLDVGRDWGPISIYHADSTRIIIRGTMVGSMGHPTIGEFFKSGYTPAAQESDQGNNAAMLRNHYASEIHLIGSECGVENMGPGQPLVMDLMISGEGGNQVGVRTLEARAIECIGVAAHNVSTCFYTNGYMAVIGCSATNSNYGFYGTSCTRFFVHSSISVGHSSGLVVDHHGRAEIQVSYFQANSNYGVFAAFNSGLTIRSINTRLNGTSDIVAHRQSYVWLRKPVAGDAFTTYFGKTTPANINGAADAYGARIDGH